MDKITHLVARETGPATTRRGFLGIISKLVGTVVLTTTSVVLPEAREALAYVTCPCPGGGSWCCDARVCYVESCYFTWGCPGANKYLTTYYVECNPVFGCDTCQWACTGPYQWCIALCGLAVPISTCYDCEPVAPC